MPRTRAMLRSRRERAILRDETVAETERCLEPRAMLRDGNDAWTERCFETRVMPGERATLGVESECVEPRAMLGAESDT